jgi:hypothetical protein
MVHKYVDKSLLPKPEVAALDFRFDTITKLEGSLNVKIIEKQKEIEKKRQLFIEQKRFKNMTLEQIEREVEKTLMEEALVVLSEDFI